MIKIAICDAVKKDRANIKNYCRPYFERCLTEYQLQEYTSGESLLETDFPDILLLDVCLEKISGLLVKEILEKKRAETRIIFVSNEESAMAQAFGKNVYGFLLKPVQQNLLLEKLKLVVDDVIEKRQYIFCKNQKNIEKIYLKDIRYIKSYGRYTKLFVRGKADYRLSDKCIGEWCEETENLDFASCHRCYLVNLFYVKKVRKNVELENEELIPISKGQRQRFCEIYKRFIWRKSYGENGERVL